jgi:nitroreductase
MNNIEVTRIDSQDGSSRIATTNSPKTLTSLMLARHSTRSFLPTPVPFNLLHDALSLTQNTPSNSNLQPWRIKIVTGDALSRLSDALISAVTAGLQPSTAPIPESYRHYRSALGKQLYGPDGYDIARSDKKGMEKARKRNYTFFGAPVGIIICMDSSLVEIDVLSVGMYVQSLCLLLAERGLGTCCEASIAGYPGVVREVLGIGKDMLVLSGIAVGYEDEDHKLNKLRAGRDGWRESVEFIA